MLLYKRLQEWKKAIPIATIFIFYSCRFHAELRPYEFQHPSMGTLFRVVAYADDSLHISSVVEKAFTHLDSLNLIMSDYIPHSELMRLSRKSGSGEFTQVSGELLEVLQQSQQWYSWSGGIFDVTIGPYSQLWRRAKRQGMLPEEDVIRTAGGSVGFEFVEINEEDEVRLQKENMQLDLGGIAKGYAVDQIFAWLVKSGYPVCLVDGGGDLRAGERPPGTEGWRVSIQTQVGEDSTMLLSDIAIATSGDFYRNLEINGKRYSHIINPFTGFGITEARAVTVLAESCTTADVLASVFSVTGPDHHELNEKLPEDCKVFIYEREEDENSLYLIEGKKATR